MLPEELERYLEKLPPASPSPDLARQIQQAVRAEQARNATWLHWRQVMMTGMGTAVAVILLVWAALETLLAWKLGGVNDFADLFSGHPDLVAQYPGEALTALLESLPLTNMLLVLGAVFIVVLLVGQLQEAWHSDKYDRRDFIASAGYD